MLGTRGCRLGILYPEIYEMQVEAIMRAAKAVEERRARRTSEIMIPLVDYEQELEILRELVVRIGDEHGLQRGRGLHGRDDDRAAAGVLRGQPDRRARRLLLVRHQRPHADRARLLARRRRVQVRAGLHGAQDHRPLAVRDDRQAGRRLARAAGRVGRPRGAPGAQARDLRRARRRPRVDRLLPHGRARLRLLLAVPRADRAGRGGAGGRSRILRDRTARRCRRRSDRARAVDRRVCRRSGVREAHALAAGRALLPAVRAREEECCAAHAVPARPRPDRPLARRSGG